MNDSDRGDPCSGKTDPSECDQTRNDVTSSASVRVSPATSAKRPRGRC